MASIDRQSNSQEQRLSPEIVNKVRERWAIEDSAAVDGQNALLFAFPNLFQPDIPRTERALPEAQDVKAAPVASTAIDLAARRAQQTQMEQDRHLAEIRERIEGLSA